MEFSPADRKTLRDALSAVPAFGTVRERQVWIRSVLEGHPFSDEIEKALQLLDWEGSALVVADALLRYLGGYEIAPGIPAVRVLAEAIEPLVGSAHREAVRRMRHRLGWTTPQSRATRIRRLSLP